MNKPFVFDKDLKTVNLGGGIKRRILACGEDLMQVKVTFAEGAVGEMHSHPHTQLTYVLEGEFEFTINGETQIVREGDTLYKLPNVDHGCVCLKAGALLDTFFPCRKDFL